jgi:hypothetical protein
VSPKVAGKTRYEHGPMGVSSLSLSVIQKQHGALVLVSTSSKIELKATLETCYIVAMQRGEGRDITDDQEASLFLA